MKQPDSEKLVLLDLNSPVFQVDLFDLQHSDLHAAIDTLKKVGRLTWNQVYIDSGLKWEKIKRVTPPLGIPALYSLRLTRSRRATAYRDQEYMRFLAIPPNHDATYGKK